MLVLHTDTQHQKKFPNYKFQPVRKEEKLAIRAEKAREREDRRREKEQYRQRQRRRMRGRGTPPQDDEAHAGSMARSSSYPGPEAGFASQYGFACE